MDSEYMYGLYSVRPLYYLHYHPLLAPGQVVHAIMVSSAKSLLWSDHYHRVKCYLPMSSLCTAPCSVDGKKVFIEKNIKGWYRSDMLYVKVMINKSETIDISSSLFAYLEVYSC